MLTPQLTFDTSQLNFADILPGQPLRRETFEALARIGYEGMELAPHAKTFAAKVYGKTARETAEFAREGGIRVAALRTADVDPAALNDGEPPHFAADCEMAAQLDSRAVVASIARLNKFLQEAVERDAVATLASFWKPTAIRAAEQGLMLVWSMRPDTLLDAPKLLQAVLAKTDEPNFGIELDVGSAAILGATQLPDTPAHAETLCALALLDSLKGNIATIRLSDGEAIDDFYPEEYDLCRCSPGHGKLDWARIIPALLDAWIPSPWWTVEPENRAQAETIAAFFRDRVTPFLPETMPNPRT